MKKTDDSKAKSKGRLETSVGTDELSSNVTRPQNNYIMGDYIESYPGGKDWHILAGTRPLLDWSRIDHDNPNRPAKVPTQQRFAISRHKSLHYKAMTTPLDMKFKVGMNLPQFVDSVQDHIDMYGLNTWTYLPNPYKSTKMLNMIDCYAKFLANVEKSIQKALEQAENFDKFDSENSKAAAGFLLASVSANLKNTLTIRMGPDEKDHFVCSWICLVNRVIQVTSTYYNKLKKEIKKCLPTSFEKEDIEKWQHSIIPKIDILLAENSYKHEITKKILMNLIQNYIAEGQFPFEVSCLLQKV